MAPCKGLKLVTELVKNRLINLGYSKHVHEVKVSDLSKGRDGFYIIKPSYLSRNNFS